MATPTFIQLSPLYTQANSSNNRFVVSGESRLYSTFDTIVNLAGLGSSFTVSGAIPVGLSYGVLTEIQETITGCSGLNIGSITTPTLHGAYVALASGTKTTDADIEAVSISRYAAIDHVVLQASGGVLNSGRVKIRACYVALA